MRYLLELYFFLFIFLSFNRELPIYFDLRYVVMILGMIVLLINLMEIIRKQEIKIVYKKLFILTMLLYLVLFVTGSNWFYNDLEPDVNDLINNFIMHLYNFLAFLLIFLNYGNLKVKSLSIYIFISGIVLLISMIMVFYGFDFYEGKDEIRVRTAHIDSDGISVFGVRVAGFAEDPNYASFLLFFWLINTFYFFKRKAIKYISIILFIFGYLLSSSKTLLVVLLVVAIYRFGNIYLTSLINKGIITLLIILPFLYFVILDRISTSLLTMQIRLNMWRKGLELFLKSPLIGSGITSFRSYFSETYWYVHSHSTFITMLSELGIIGYYLFISIFIFILRTKYKLSHLVVITFIIFALVSELFYLHFYVLFIFLLPIMVYIKHYDSVLLKGRRITR